MKRLSQGLHLSLILFLALALLPSFPSGQALGKQAGRKKARSGSVKPQAKQSSRTTARKSGRVKRSRSTASLRARQRAARNRRAALRMRQADLALKNKSQEFIAKDDLRFEDIQIRRAALDALGGHAGSVVVMDPHTGRVLSIVNQEWAVRKAFKPCSTIKPFVALAGLKEGLIDPAEPVSLGRRALPLTLSEALAHSNNPYFQLIGMKLGLPKLLEYARLYGLGQRTGINLAHESAGRIPQSRKLRTSAVGHMSSHGDGFEVTGLQLAVFTSALINGGYIYQPQVVAGTPNHVALPDKKGALGLVPTVQASTGPASFKPVLLRHIDIAREHRDDVVSGMIGAVEFGTAKLAYYPSLSIAGKTGTCTGSHLRLGLFTSFATVDRPNLVVVVITNGVGEKGPVAAQVAGSIYQRIANRFVDAGTVGAVGGH
ncbi:MAG: hypothetical protein HY650_03625 [Acidobacteria bacterium]|nr:hypothetical protein [Acidobacteriota bacterium]